MIRVLIVDDHHMVRQGLAAAIGTQADVCVVAQAGDAAEAVELFDRHRPDLTLMDLRLPGRSGLEAILEIRRRHPNSRFIILTTYEGDEDVYRAIKAGVQGYLLKGMHFEELMSAIRAVHAGLRHLPGEILERLEERIPGNDLTPRELAVLKCIVQGKGNREIAFELHLTYGTVKQYVNAIIGKLGTSDRTQAASEAIRRGLVHWP